MAAVFARGKLVDIHLPTSVARKAASRIPPSAFPRQRLLRCRYAGSEAAVMPTRISFPFLSAPVPKVVTPV